MMKIAGSSRWDNGRDANHLLRFSVPSLDIRSRLSTGHRSYRILLRKRGARQGHEAQMQEVCREFTNDHYATVDCDMVRAVFNS